MRRSSIIDRLDEDTLNTVLWQFSGSDSELAISCTCRTFNEIMKKKRKTNKLRTSIIWITNSASTIHWTYMNYLKIPYPRMVINALAAKGIISLIELACSYSNLRPDYRTCCYAAANGHLHVLQWLHLNNCPFDSNVCVSAAMHGHTHILQWLHSVGCEWDEEVPTAAVGGSTANTKNCWDNQNEKASNGGHFLTLLWLQRNGCPMDYHSILSAAIRNNHIFIVDWIRVNKYVDLRDRNYLCNEAVQSGHLDMLIYLNNHGVSWDEDGMPLYTAALNGYVDIMEYAFQKGCQVPEVGVFSLCDAGAYNGHLNVIKWARAHGCYWDEHTFSYAALHDDIEMIEWLYNNGCPWDDSTCYSAASFGHLEILKWVRERGCPWGLEACCAAAYSGHLHVIVWALENGCPWNDKIYEIAVKGGNRHIVQWLRNLKYV